jgi:hypothetical protein
VLVSVHPGVEEAAVRERTGFALGGSPEVTPEPSPDVLEVLRSSVDRTGVLA